MRRAAKRDANEALIVEALERSGVLVWRSLPCDLLTLYRDVWRPLEVKDPDARPRYDQEKQATFLALTGTPIVRTPEDALRALRVIR